MAVDERNRHRLYERLEQVLGADEASILMEHLPPVGWADVATKRDLDLLAETFRRDHESLAETFRRDHHALLQSLETMEQRILATTRADLLQQTRTLMFALLTATISVGGLAFAAARLV